MVNMVDLKPSNCPNDETFSSSEDELRDTCTSVAHSLGTKRRKIETLGTLGTEPKKRRNTSFHESKKSFGREHRKIETLGTLGTKPKKRIPSFQTESKMRIIRRLQTKLWKARLGAPKIDSDLSDEASNSLSQDELFHDAVILDEESESSYYSTPETRNSDGNYNLIENILMSIRV